MAVRYRLIPEQLWDQLRAGHGEASVATLPPTTTNSVEMSAQILPPAAASSLGQDYERLIQDLPRNCRRKSKTILSYLGQELNLDTHLRVHYKDDTLGGHVNGNEFINRESFAENSRHDVFLFSDLLCWTTMPKLIATRMEKPVDAARWLEMLRACSVPPSCYKDRLLNDAGKDEVTIKTAAKKSRKRKAPAEKQESVAKKKKKKKKKKWLKQIPV